MDTQQDEPTIFNTPPTTAYHTDWFCTLEQKNRLLTVWALGENMDLNHEQENKVRVLFGWIFFCAYAIALFFISTQFLSGMANKVLGEQIYICLIVAASIF